jgi:hypothetical protein
LSDSESDSMALARCNRKGRRTKFASTNTFTSQSSNRLKRKPKRKDKTKRETKQQQTDSDSSTDSGQPSAKFDKKASLAPLQSAAAKASAVASAVVLAKQPTPALTTQFIQNSLIPQLPCTLLRALVDGARALGLVSRGSVNNPAAKNILDLGRQAALALCHRKEKCFHCGGSPVGRKKLVKCATCDAKWHQDCGDSIIDLTSTTSSTKWDRQSCFGCRPADHTTVVSNSSSSMSIYSGPRDAEAEFTCSIAPDITKADVHYQSYMRELQDINEEIDSTFSSQELESLMSKDGKVIVLPPRSATLAELQAQTKQQQAALVEAKFMLLSDYECPKEDLAAAVVQSLLENEGLHQENKLVRLHPLAERVVYLMRKLVVDTGNCGPISIVDLPDGSRAMFLSEFSQPGNFRRGMLIDRYIGRCITTSSYMHDALEVNHETGMELLASPDAQQSLTLTCSPPPGCSFRMGSVAAFANHASDKTANVASTRCILPVVEPAMPKMEYPYVLLTLKTPVGAESELGYDYNGGRPDRKLYNTQDFVALHKVREKK